VSRWRRGGPTTSPDAWWEATERRSGAGPTGIVGAHSDRVWRARCTVCTAREDGQAVRPAILVGRWPLRARSWIATRDWGPRLRRFLPPNPHREWRDPPFCGSSETNRAATETPAGRYSQRTGWLEAHLGACSDHGMHPRPPLCFSRTGGHRRSWESSASRSICSRPSCSHQLVGAPADGAALTLARIRVAPSLAGAADTAASLVGHGQLKPGKVLPASGPARADVRSDAISTRPHAPHPPVSHGRGGEVGIRWQHPERGLAMDWCAPFSAGLGRVYRMASQAPTWWWVTSFPILWVSGPAV